MLVGAAVANPLDEDKAHIFQVIQVFFLTIVIQRRGSLLRNQVGWPGMANFRIFGFSRDKTVDSP